MEMICIGFLGGVIFSVILIAGGVCINDKGNNKGKLDGDNSSDDNISSGDGDRSWDYRYYTMLIPILPDLRCLILFRF